MTDVACDRLADLLSRATGPAAFSTSTTAPPDDLLLEVRGVGPIKLPISEKQARELSLLGRPARYGQGEKTVLDHDVRDTWEIPKSRVKIDKRRWAQTLAPVLERVSRGLGLPDGRELRAELHSMLVYGPGQFFLEHQDSEKEDAMIASLIVGLPSRFEGGTLEVRHGSDTITYRGSKKALSFVAFYSDCRHQAKPVSSGHRVVLTYNLLLREDDARSVSDHPDPHLVKSLARCLEEHFADGHDRLVYLLDHEYTSRGLSFSRLKGADGSRALSLLPAADLARCEVALALVNVREVWSAFEERDIWEGRSGWEEDDEDSGSSEGDGARDDDYALQELIDSEVTLESWSASSGGRFETIDLPVCDDVVCESTASGNLDPYASEYEGYMGNWGNTLDRWYHRGAIVIWPADRDFAVRGQASPSWALGQLRKRVRMGDVAGAREEAATLAPFWDAAVARVDERVLFRPALSAARELNDAALATMLLRPFALETLTSRVAPLFAALVARYGAGWAEQLVTGWADGGRCRHTGGETRAHWITSLPKLCLAVREAAPPGSEAASLLLSKSLRWAKESIEEGVQISPPSSSEQHLLGLASPIAAIFESAATLRAGKVRDEALAVLTSDEQLLDCAFAVLRRIPRPRWAAAGLQVLAFHCSAAFEARIATPSRAEDDWSIELPDGCECELCGELRAFLEDRGRTDFEWPLAKNRRAHIHRRIDCSELPVTHQTTRTGRPYTLVLKKTDELFRRERLRRRNDKKDLAWLRGRPTDRSRSGGQHAQRSRETEGTGGPGGSVLA